MQDNIKEFLEKHYHCSLGWGVELSSGYEVTQLYSLQMAEIVFRAADWSCDDDWTLGHPIAHDQFNNIFYFAAEGKIWALDGNVSTKPFEAKEVCCEEEFMNRIKAAVEVPEDR